MVEKTKSTEYIFPPVKGFKVLTSLKGYGHYVPKEVIDNSRFEGLRVHKYGYDGKMNEPTEENKIISSNEKIVKLMGIRERRYGNVVETVDYMGAKAVAQALEDSGIALDNLEGIITATVTSERGFPSTSCEIQERLGIINGNKRFYALDIGAACAGYPAAISVASSLIESGAVDGPLAVVAVEKLSPLIAKNDINSPLFGDGAGAVIIGKNSNNFEGLEGKIKATYMGSETTEGRNNLIFRSEYNELMMPEGNKVMKYAVKNMADAVSYLKEKTGWTNDDIDLVIPHQANIRILQAVARTTKLPWEKVYNNIEKYGNMSSATCAVALSEAMKENRLKKDSKVIVVSFGSGLVTSAFALDYSN